MKPMSPVLPGVPLAETQVAKDQPQYRPLPVVYQDGYAISRWTLTWRERFKVLFGGSLWLCQMNFGQPLQPQLPSVKQPIIRRDGVDYWVV
jgi:hypothetical protein